MNTLFVLVAVVAAVAAAPQKEAAPKAFSFSNGAFPANQAYYPGQQNYYYPGYQGYNTGFRGSYYPGQQAGYQGYYPGYQGYYQGYQGYNQAYNYPGYNGANRGYYPGAPAFPAAAASAFPAVTPAPAVVPVVAPAKIAAPVYKSVDGKLPAIVRQSQEVNFDGNFKYGYETENGIVAQATGYVKNAGSENAAQVIEGSYAYIGDDGAPVEVKYYADETGYHAVGNVVPTTPPEIARSLELIASQPQKPEDSKKK